MNWATIAVVGLGLLALKGRSKARAPSGGRKLPRVARLSTRQKSGARAIIQTARAAGYPDGFIAAMLANAYAESFLGEYMVGDGGVSVGLFQINTRANSGGPGAGMDPDSLHNDVLNTKTILKDHEIDRVLARYREGVSVATLSADFAKWVERPSWSTLAGQTFLDGMEERRERARQLFGATGAGLPATDVNLVGWV